MMSRVRKRIPGWRETLAGTLVLAYGWQFAFAAKKGLRGPPPPVPPAVNTPASPAGFPFRTATPETLTDEQVVEAMRRGVDFLFKSQKDGTWETPGAKATLHPMTGGATALATYALVHAGNSLKDQSLRPNLTEAESAEWARLNRRGPALRAAFTYLAELRTDMNYVRAYQLAALAQLPSHGNDPEAQNNLKLLRNLAGLPQSSFLRNGRQGYALGRSDPVTNQWAQIKPPGEWWDTSNIQVQLLALYEAAHAGVEIRSAYFAAQEKFWRTTQNPDGSWLYGCVARERLRPLPMTAAGIASLYILQEYTEAQVRSRALPDKHLEAGLAWLDKNFDPQGILSGQGSEYYFLYCLERVGLAAGRKFIGKHDWYRTVAATLLRRQSPDGSWPIIDAAVSGRCPVVPTAFALIFLARGRNPTGFNKLSYPGDTWDARPRDVANLTQYMVRAFERPVNWQVVDASLPVEEWQDAPVLLITGSQDPKFTPDQIDKLRKFITAGGLVFSTADDGSAAFTRAIEKCVSDVTGGKYDRMRELPAQHPIFHLWGECKKPPRMLGISNGARELWIHSTVDMGAAWQRRAYANEDYFTVPVAVFFYAAGGKDSLSPRLRSQRIAVPATPARERIALARLEYAGNWDPEPGAWPRFSKLMRAEAGADLAVENVKLEELDVSRHKIAHLTGTASFTINEAGLTKLKAFLAGGGTLLIDNCGGNDPFSAAATTLCSKLKEAPSTVPAGHRLYSGEIAGSEKIDDVEYRRSARLKGGLGRRPNVLGTSLGDRYGILLSNEDITSGLLGTNTHGIIGYTAPHAVRIARNLILYGAHPTGAATQPAPATRP